MRRLQRRQPRADERHTLGAVDFDHHSGLGLSRTFPDIVERPQPSADQPDCVLLLRVVDRRREVADHIMAVPRAEDEHVPSRGPDQDIVTAAAADDIPHRTPDQDVRSIRTDDVLDADARIRLGIAAQPEADRLGERARQRFCRGGPHAAKGPHDPVRQVGVIDGVNSNAADQRVESGPAVQHVVSTAAIEPIIAIAAAKTIVARPPTQHVVARASRQEIGALIPRKHVVAQASPKRVVPFAAREAVRIRASAERMEPAPPGRISRPPPPVRRSSPLPPIRVSFSPPPKSVSRPLSPNRELRPLPRPGDRSRRPEKEIGTFPAGHRVVTRVSLQDVSSRASSHPVAPVPADEAVPVVPTAQPIVAAAAEERVPSLVAMESIGLASARKEVVVATAASTSLPASPIRVSPNQRSGCTESRKYCCARHDPPISPIPA